MKDQPLQKIEYMKHFGDYWTWGSAIGNYQCGYCKGNFRGRDDTHHHIVKKIKKTSFFQYYCDSCFHEKILPALELGIEIF